MNNVQISNEKLYKEFYPKVYSFVSSRIENNHDREDIVSEIFLKVFSKLETFDESKASLSTWIYTITKNTVINHLKRKKFAFIPFHEYFGVKEDISDKDYLENFLDRLDNALDKLIPIQKDIIILRYYFELSHKEISEKVNLSYASTRKQCSLALAELRRLM